MKAANPIPARAGLRGASRLGDYSALSRDATLKRERERERCIRLLMHLALRRDSQAHVPGTYLPPETTLNNLPHNVCDPIPLADPNILPVHLKSTADEA